MHRQKKHVCDKRILLAAGGTGGHVFPAIALAELLKERYSVSLMTDRRGARYLTSSHRAFFERIFISPMTHFSGSILTKFVALLRFIYTGCVTPFSMRNLDVVVGFGGFSSFWPLLWGRIFRKPTLLYQTDRIMGQANRFLKPFATQIATGFAHTINLNTPMVHVGLVTRSDFRAQSYTPPKASQPFHLLILGGSQGARSFAHTLPQAVSLLPDTLKKRLQIVQQCRTEDISIAHNAYDPKIAIQLIPFIEDMASALTKAHLVISRAGTSSIGEIAHIGRPALFVPYPYAKNNHQYLNAQAICEREGGFMLTQDEFTPIKLAHLLEDVMNHPDRLAHTTEELRKFFPPGATQSMAHLVDVLARAP